MSNETKIDFTKPLEYVGGDGMVRPFELLTTKGRGDYPVMGYLGDKTALTELEQELNAYRDELELTVAKIVAIGVIAHNPDPNLHRTGKYIKEWNSQQAEDVRKLRDERDSLKRQLKQRVPHEPKPAHVESLIADFEGAVRIYAINKDKYTAQDVRNTRAALLAAFASPPPASEQGEA